MPGPSSKLELWVERARTAILALLETEHAVVWPEVEAKLADRVYEPLGYKIDPHHLTTARIQLLAEHQIDAAVATTRGGRLVTAYAPAERRLRLRAVKDAAARKRLLYARWRSWSDYFGKAGERVSRASLLAAAMAGYRPIVRDAGEVRSLFGQPVSGGPLDSGATLQVMDDMGRPVGIVTVPIEVKNIRHWIYPTSQELYELLDKACQLQLANPTDRFLPVLVCRRAHTTAFRMAKDLGFFVADARAHFVLPIAEVDPAQMQEIVNELGFYDLVRTDAADRNLTKRFEEDIPAYAWAAAERFALVAPSLAPFASAYRQQRPEQISTAAIVAELPPWWEIGTAGGW